MTRTLAANEGGAGRAVLVTRILDKGVHVLTEAKLTGAVSYTHLDVYKRQCSSLEPLRRSARQPRIRPSTL